MNLKLEYDSFQDFANRLWPCLSEEGMWVRSDDPASVGEVVDFEVMLADGFRLFHGTGQVIAVGRGPRDGEPGEGMTLRFGQLDQPSRNLVRKVVSKHIGEGGRLFVLAAPATKVEVFEAGDSQAGSAGAAGAMGPEDLVAPFKDLDKESAWSDESEPELTSFLRPSARARDAAAEGGADSQSAAAGADPGVAPGEAPAAPAEVDGPASDRGAKDASFDLLWEDEPEAEPEAAEEASAPTPADEPVESLEESAEESAEALLLDLDEEAAPALGATQRVEPGARKVEEYVPRSRFELDDEIEPLHSTVIPPAAGGGEDATLETYEPATDEFLIGGEASSAAARWPWVVIGGLVLGIALFLLLRLDTPLARLFGGEAATAPAARESVAAGRPAGPRPPRPATSPDQSGAATSEAATADAGTSDAGTSDAGISEAETSDAGAPEVGAAEDGAGGASEPAPGGDAATGEGAAAEPARSERAAAQDAPPVAPAAGEPRSERARESAAGNGTASAEPAPPAASGAALPSLRLQRITWRQEDGDTIVRLALDGAPTDDRFETVRVAGDNPRLVLKIDGVAGSVPRQPVAIGSAEVRQLRFGVHNVEGIRQVHVVADLAAESVQLVGPVRVDAGGVELRFARP